MKAVIAAAGEGRRMLPLSLKTPKPMLAVLNKPLLAHQLDALPQEVTDVYIVVGYKKELIQQGIGAEYNGKKIRYIVQDRATGNGDAVLLAKPYIEAGERFYLMWADDLIDATSIRACLEYPSAVVVSEVADPRRYGVLVTNDSGHVIDIEEKPENPKSNLVACGVYVLNSDIFNYSPDIIKGERTFAGMLLGFCKDHPVSVVEAKQWIPIATPEDLVRAEEILNN